MSSRLDIPLVLLILGVVLMVSALIFNTSIFVKGPLGLLFTGLSPTISLFAIYWGLVVRKGMAVWLYRNQALGVSLVSLGIFPIYVLFSLIAFTSSNVPFLNSSAGFLVVVDPWILLTFFWIDSSMRASQDMDPLTRDSLHWTKVRYPLWALNLVGTGELGFLIVTGNYGFLDKLPPGLTSNIIYLLAITPFLVPYVAGIVALPIGAVRSRDRNFRKQLQWFALSLLALLGFSSLGTFFPNPIQANFYGVADLAAAYCLYRSAHSLVPLNKIQSH